MISGLVDDKVTNQGELIIVYLCLYLDDPTCLPGVRGQMTQRVALLQFAENSPFATSSQEQQDLFVVEFIDLFAKTWIVSVIS